MKYLYNCYFGEADIPPAFSSVNIGNLEISIVEDYSDLKKKLPRQASNEIVFSLTPEGLVPKSEHRPEFVGEWVPTIKIIELASGDKSILAREPIEDNGIWDVCQLLTFINGRRVCEDDQLERFSLRSFGFRCCNHFETLSVLKVAWDNKATLMENNLFSTLLLNNASFGEVEAHIFASVFSTCLNIITDDWAKRNPIDKIDVKARRRLRSEINRIVDEFDGLLDEEKSAYKGLLGSKVMQGTSSAIVNMQAFLKGNNLVSDPITSDENDRIKFINMVRNRIVHSGNIPEFKNNPSISIDLAILIVANLLPKIVRFYLGDKLGFSKNGTGSLAMHSEAIFTFFNQGVLDGHRIEEVSLNEWLESEEYLWS